MNEIKEHLKAYHSELVSIVKKGDFNEHTFRTPLENLLNALKPKDIRLTHEPKAEQGQGSVRPDFKIYKQTPHYEALQGFIECKNYKENLDTLVKGKQIEKYLAVCPNIILTDYNRFILLSFGKVIADITLFPFGLENTLFTQEKAKDIEIQNAFIQLLQSFFESVANITNKDELVAILSTQSFYLSETIFKSDEAGLLNTQFKESFEKAFATFASLENTPFSKIEFCDILAQSVVYGMFVAYIENDEFEIDKIPIQSFIQLLPQHFLTLQEFVYYSLPFFALPENIKYALENVKKTIALIDKPSLATSFEKEIQSLSIYLYEDFLKAYDTLRGEQRRKEGGVFYTPQPVVNMIVSSLNELLQSKFDKKGFNDESVKVLDFATGTGSFLAKVFELILANESEVFAKELIINKCLKDIYGFELSFVPYIVAHLKLSSILRQKGFSDLNLTHKFQIFLTNTLDLDGDKQIQMQVPFDSLKGQRDEALKLKRQEDLLVILGNPPYNVKSKNKGKEILELLQSYKQGLNETKLNLDDDYIKFIRFAQWKLLEQNQKQGLMGFITNNSFLDGRTHRKMRQSLARAFDEIYILNLHGDSGDENVFDIRVGVCISLFVKYKDTYHTDTPSCHTERSEVSQIQNRDFSLFTKAQNDNLATIFYYSTNDNGILKRNDKFALLNSLAQNGLNSAKWQELKLDEPYFWFVPKSFENDEYENFWALAGDKALGESKAIFENFSSGVENKRNSISICFNKTDLEQILSDFCELSVTEIKSKYGLEENNINVWIEKAKADIRSVFADKNLSLNDKTLKSPLPCGGGLGVGIKIDKSPSHRPLAPYMKEFSRAMRKNPTEAENKLWQELRSKKLGFGFRRQFVIDSKYIADFVCLEKRLIIECDGGQHATINTPPQTPPARGGAYSTSPSLAEGLTSTHSPSLVEGDKGGGYDINHPDIERNFYLESQNFRILRFWNNEILENLEGVLSVIKEALNDDNFASAKFTHPLTPSAREGEQDKNSIKAPPLAGGVGEGYPYAKVFYYSTNDNGILKRNDKFALLNSIAQNGLNSVKWQELKLDEPYFWFVSKSFENDEYENFWALAGDKALGESKAIFLNFGSGISTDRDELTIDIQKDNLIEKCQKAFSGKFDENFETQYKIHNSSSYAFADKLKALEFDENALYPINYRPFDKRFVYYKLGFTSRPSYETMQHFIKGENLGLCFPKNRLSPNSHYGLVVNTLADRALGGAKTGSETYIAPLYLYQDSEKEVGKISKIPNFTPEFKEFIIKSKVLKDKSVEQILAFIYANLFNPAYRKKYLEYLKIGFPRVNFEVSKSKFETFAKIGQRLIDLHLLKNIPNDESIALKFSDKADKQKPNFTLEKPRFIDDKIMLNKDLEIVGIAKSIFEFSIGGYKVLDKWLKYRVGKALSKAELEHLVNVACIIKETIKIQNELENLAQKDKK